MAVLLGAGPTVRGEDSDQVDLLQKEKQISQERMRQIYDAIQDYRKEHKELPAYISDLYPQFIADTNTFLCPTAVRLGKKLPFPELLDPKLTVDYGYEFSARPIKAMFGYTGPMTMAAWKRMQMMVAGGIVPILRCFAYDQVLNMSFDGKIYESPLQWEDLVVDKINAHDLEPRHLRLMMLQQLGGEGGGEALAFEQLQDAVSSNNRGVVVSDKPLSESNLKWNREVMQASLAAADQAAQFLSRFPQSSNASSAAKLEQRMLLKAATAGSEQAGQRLDTLLAKELKEPGLSEDKQFELRLMQFQAAQAKLNTAGAEEKRQASQTDARALIREFPKREQPYAILLSSVDLKNEAAVRAVAQEVRQSPDAPQGARDRADAMLNRLNLFGNPPEIRFTALDGREVDIANLKGRVVLVDFWATWCGPCVGEIPHVKEAYEKYHPQGFDIVGISLDSDKAALEKFVKAKELPWPQCFDGKGWQNKISAHYGIESIPAMWLVDQKGNIVDTNAREDLAGKVARLLAQNDEIKLGKK
jgi:thiol-disulfide isomerase/thioredoxin